MILLTRGRIIDKWTVPGEWFEELPLPDASYLAIWFYDPQTHTFRERSFRCTVRQYEYLEVGDWVQLRRNTAIWWPFQRWVIDRRISPPPFNT